MKVGAKIGAVILASGFSSRMGDRMIRQHSGKNGKVVNKLLIPYRGKALVEHVMDSAAFAGFSRCFVVTAYEAVAYMSCRRGFDVILNDHPESGQSRSVVLGTQAGKDMDGLMFIPGDMPFLTPGIFSEMLETYERHPGHIIRAVYSYGPGSPALFPSSLYHELETLTGDNGGKTVILKYPEKVFPVKIADPQAGVDIDTPEEAGRWLGL
ncbi:nucleotidyltransferase family protein [Catenibacillus scindens]|uniref:nucleotidyltransferase family protein n=1 Tax=Catenibacillus scindens TaxID=673271 RepID=UPI0032092166